MSTVHAIETAVRQLSRQELLSFRDWFAEFAAAAWDQQFEADVAAGRLDALADEVIRDGEAKGQQSRTGVAPVSIFTPLPHPVMAPSRNQAAGNRTVSQ